MALSTAQKQTLRLASRQQVEQIASTRLLQHASFSRWLNQTNRYRVKTIDRIRRDGATPNELHLKDYVVASSPLHVIDGWSFLGRAIDSLMRGDADSARHLAYYAELRAAMSLLASEGVGIFSRRQFIIDNAGNCHRLNTAGTHAFVWPCLEHWSGLRKARDLLDQIVCPHGVLFSDWVDAAGLTGSIQALARSWMRSWGLDLRLMSEDHESRNEASYRPTAFRMVPPISARDTAIFVESIWALFEPDGTGNFTTLDRLLVRKALRTAFEGHSITTHGSVNENDYQNRINGMVNALGFAPALGNSLVQFFTRTIQPDDPAPLQDAARTDSVEHPRHHVQVIARAAMLLRIATGSARLLLQSAGLDSAALAFWWTEVGQQRALWDSNSSPTQSIDTWGDIQPVLSELAQWTANFGSVNSEIREWRLDPTQSAAIVELSGFEVIGLWGLVG